MKRAVIVLAACVALLGALAAPAQADSFRGIRDITWQGHCGTTVTLYMNTQSKLPPLPNGFIWSAMNFNGTTCVGAPYGIRPVQIAVQTIVLWFQCEGCTGWQNLAHNSGTYSVSDLKFHEPLITTDTTGVGCGIGLGIIVHTGDKVHVEAKYRITWGDGTTTQLRDDNSYDWVVPNGGCS